MEKIFFENAPSTNTPINAENMNKLQENVENAIKENTDDITKNSTQLDNIGKYYYSTNASVACKANTSNKLSSLTLPSGVYVVTSHFYWEGADLRFFHGLGSQSTSAYDNAGSVSSTITYIFETTEEKTITPTLWPNKTITVSCNTKAVKIK